MKIFSSFLSGFNVTSQKKKGHRADVWHLFLQLYVDVQKIKNGPLSEFCNFSLRFVRHTRARHPEPQLATVFGRKQKRRFWQEKKRQNSQNFSAKMPQKFCTFLRLQGTLGEISFPFLGHRIHVLLSSNETLFAFIRSINLSGLLYMIWCRT